MADLGKYMGLSVEVVAAIVGALLTALGGAASSEVFKRPIEHILKREREPALIEDRRGDFTLAEGIVRADVSAAVVGNLLYPGASRMISPSSRF